ncbi:MAG: nicotinate-nucleotide adenylyltransferase [Pseudomonadota bacterium]
MRIGLFGGTFNPIHFGHIHVSKEIKHKFELDQLYMIPSAIPPHKKRQGVADARDRLNMTRLAVSSLDGYLVSDVEITRSGPSYTVDTIDYFQNALPENAKIFLILGMDAFLEIDTWKSYKKLFTKLPLIIMSRPGTEHVGFQELSSHIREKISDHYYFQKNCNCFEHQTKQSIYLVKVSPYDISSTDIRKIIRRKQSLKYLVPEKVEQYIKNKGLYLHDI